MGDEGGPPPSASWGRWYTLATSFVAPATFLTGLLFYFGYVSARAQYSYFGVDVDTLGLGTRDYVMRSPQGLLVPAMMLLLIGAGTAAVMAAFRSGRVGPRATRALAVAGGVVGIIGLVLVLLYPVLGGWTGYALLTPVVLALGAGVLALAGRYLGFAPSVTVLLVLFVVVATFWATATLAQWTGRGLAERTARHLDELPAVVLDTHERLYLRDAVTEETVLPADNGTAPDDGQVFHYRYYGLRLLVQAGNRIFLVPERWDPSNSTLMLDIDDVRVKFRFVNQPP